MDDLLFERDNLSSYIYIVGEEDLLDIAKKTGVPPSLIIADNNLCCEVQRGMALVIKKRGKMRMLLPDEGLSKEKEAQLKEKNKVDFLYPFQLVVD